MKILVSILILILVISLLQPTVFAHRSGCHRWHSCLSDTGSYECGDLGYDTYCPKKQKDTPSSPSGSSPSVSSTKPKTIAIECDQSLWDHVYNPKRLQIIDKCKIVSGIIEKIRAEKDGDFHITLKLDSQYSNLINDANRKFQHGNMVVEVICQLSVTQEDAKKACSNFIHSVNIPKEGTHVKVTGSYVLDKEHSGWAEIHPVTSIEKI